jgi:hypothetical protein
MTEKRCVHSKSARNSEPCGKPAKYLYRVVATGYTPLCGIHARRLKDSIHLRKIEDDGKRAMGETS